MVLSLLICCLPFAPPGQAEDLGEGPYEELCISSLQTCVSLQKQRRTSVCKAAGAPAYRSRAESS